MSRKLWVVIRAVGAFRVEVFLEVDTEFFLDASEFFEVFFVLLLVFYLLFDAYEKDTLDLDGRSRDLFLNAVPSNILTAVG